MGEWVYLCLQPYRQISISQHRELKLAPRYYGQFQITQKIGSVAYKLDLPPTARIHPTFHMSQLKKKLETRVTALPVLPPVDAMGVLKP